MKQTIKTKHLGHALTTLPTSQRTLVVLFALLLTSTGAWADITGSGTEADPYVLSTVADWNTFAARVNAGTNADKYYKLSDSWDNSSSAVTATVGTESYPFSGTFDGNGKTITANIDETSTQGTAPFRWISGATIKNLTVNGTVTGTTHAAGLVGFATNATNTIDGCTVTATVSGGTHNGGVVGHGKTGTLIIKNTVFSGTLGSGSSYSGGLQGWSDGNTLTITDCLFSGSYSGSGSFHPVAIHASGKTTTATVTNCYYTAAPTLTNTNFIAATGTKAYASASDIPSGAPYTEVTAADGQKYYVVNCPEGLSIDTDYSYGTAGFYYVNMPKTDTNTLTLSDASVTTFKVYDDGGKSGDYSCRCDGTLTLTAPTGYVLQLSGSITTQITDYLTVYDGSDNHAKKLLNAESSSSNGTETAITTVVSSGQSMTLYFDSDGSNVYAGLDLTVTLISTSTESAITVNTATDGSVTASVDGTSATTAKVNDVVTLTAMPESGYLLSGISVTDGSSNAVAVTGGWYNNNLATFTMPASAVTVTPTFTNIWTADGGLYINMPTTDTESVTIPSGVQSFKVYDDGGASGNYSDNCDGTLVLTAPTGYLLQLSGSIKTEKNCDILTVYDGSTTSGNKLLNAVSSSSNGTETAITTVVSTGQNMTLYFDSDGGKIYAGLDLTVTLISTSTEYNINGIGETTGGSVAATVNSTSVSKAKVSETVTLTATPSEGYLLSDLSVTDANSNAIAVTDMLWYANTNTATFTMPGSAVTVTPTFTNDLTSLYINMPTTGTKNVTIPSGVTSFKVYDDGGASGNYSNNCAGTLTLTAPMGYVLQLSGSIKTENSCDKLTVYDGSTTSGNKLLNAVSSTSSGTQTAINTVTSTGQSMTLYFYSDNGSNYAGLDLTVTLVSTSTEYNINGIGETTGGSVAASVSNASASTAKVSETVTLTATPSEGYLLSDLSVTDANSNAIAVTDMLWYANTNTATFTMPASAVNVTPTFTNTWTADGGLSINMPTTDTESVTIPSGVQSFKVYDDGGASGNYSNDCAGTLTLTAPTGYLLQLSGSITTPNNWDYLTIYDGSTTSGTEVLKVVTSSGTETTITTVTSSGQSMTLYFYSDESYNDAGLDLTVTLVPITYTVTFNANGGMGYAMAAQNFTYDVAQALTANTYTRAGYTFAGWATTADDEKAYDDQQSVSNLTTTDKANVELFAKWDAKPTTVTASEIAESDFSGYWCTYYNSYSNVQVDDNTTIYTISAASGSTATLSAVSNKIIKAGEGVILKSTESSIGLTYTSTAATDADYESNLLEGCDATTTISISAYADKVIYTLAGKSGGFGLYHYTGTTLGANKAFLPLNAAASASSFVFSMDDVTGIEKVEKVESRESRDESFYTLDGRKLPGKPSQKGLYIYNGRKVIIK